MKTTLLPLHELQRHPDNAREKGEYSKKDLAELSASIEEHGLLQPLVVSKDDGGFTILAGHRRHAALSALGRETAPCVVLDADEQEGLAVLLTENAQHRAPNPLREAEAVARLVGGFSEEAHPYDRAAALLGKSVAWVRGRMRLTALSAGWRKAMTDPESAVPQWPVGHLELVAALPETVQDRLLEEYADWAEGGIPLAADLRTAVARYTEALDRVPWDLDADGVAEGVPACSACPKRDSAQGRLFGPVDGKKGDRCLDSVCYAAKAQATVLARVEEAKQRHGPALAVETCWGFENVALPEGLDAYREHELVPLAKGKGGLPVLRLRTMKVAFLGKAARTFDAGNGKAARPLGPDGKAAPKSLEERREDLEKRRLIRALALFRDSMLGQVGPVADADGLAHKAHDGDGERHAAAPVPEVPRLLDVVALALAYGTGPSVDPDEPLDCAPYAEGVGEALRSSADDQSGSLGARLWNRVREPIARALRILGPMKPEAVRDLAAQARAVCGVCGFDWERDFLAPAVAAIAEPKSWARVPRSPARSRASVS